MRLLLGLLRKLSCYSLRSSDLYDLNEVMLSAVMLDAYEPHSCDADILGSLQPANGIDLVHQLESNTSKK